MEDKIMIAYVWFLTIGFAFFYGFEFGTMKMEKEIRDVYQSRISDARKLDNCNAIVSRRKIANQD